MCYGQVFAIFGLAHAYRVTRDESLLTAALETCEQVHNHFRDSTGSLQPVLEHDFGGEAPYRSQNPLMHLVEALLALDEATQSTQHGQRAANWIDFLFDAAFARGDAALPEFYDTHWQPLATPPAESSEEGCIIPGHQFEWAYLLSKGVELGLPDRYLGHARFALDAGLRFGSDSVHGGIVRAVDAAGKVCDDRKVFWQQTEAIRSLARFHIHHGIQAYEQPLRASLDFYRAHLCDADFGGVYTEVQRDGHAMDPNKGSIWKVDYHTVAMIAELLSLQPDNPAPSPAN